MLKFKDFPKLQSPFIRKMINGHYVVIDEIDPECKWFLDDDVIVNEKIHGCLHYSQLILTDKGYIKMGHIVNKKLPVKVASYNFEKQVVEFKEIEHYHKAKKGHNMICVNVQSRNHGNRLKNIVCTTNHKFWSKGKWIEAKNLKKGQELFHMANEKTGLKQSLGYEWLPFDWIRRHCYYKAWGRYPKDFATISTWLKDDLLPLYALKKGDKQGFVEGIVFYKKSTGQMCKIRKDMFDWFKGDRHRGVSKE